MAATLTLVAVILVAVVETTSISAADTMSKKWPYWNWVAASESDNGTRINYVRHERRERVDRLQEIDQRMHRLQRQRAVVRKQIARHDKLLSYLQKIVGYVAWLNDTGDCESDNYADHSDSGTYHGRYQADLRTWAGYGGYRDPHGAPWFVQDGFAVDLRERRGTSPWPNCG